MHLPSAPPPFSRPASGYLRTNLHSGSALLITLSILTIVTIIVVAFTVAMRLELATSKTYTEGFQAEKLASGAALWIVSDLLREISGEAASDVLTAPTGAVGTNAFAIYRPKTPADMRPFRWTNGLSGTNALPNVVVRSSRLSTLPTSSYASTTTGTATKLPRPICYPSGVPSGNSTNGRYSSKWWNSPRLLATNEVASLPVPEWVYVNRQGPTEVAALSQGMKDSTSEEFVVGRFAYVVYDVGGLLDANLAGYPQGGDQPGNLDLARKGSLLFADLREVGLSESQIHALASWRNEGSLSRGPNSQDLVDWVFGDGAKSGFLKPAEGDRRFVSRQDLLNFADRQGWGDAVRFFTLNSVDRNAPSWFPPFNAPSGSGFVLGDLFQYRSRALDYRPTDADASRVVNHHLGTVRKLTGSDRGALLIPERFPLSRLALLTPDATAASGSEIHKYFGLLRNSPSEPWTYTSPDGSGIASRVKTLHEVAMAGREPDFFELLSAAILQGSSFHSNTQDVHQWYDRNGTPNNAGQTQQPNLGHIALKAGTSIIDQFDDDSFPTAVNIQLMDRGTVAAPGLSTYTVAGIENLPYLSEKLVKLFRDPASNLRFGVWFAYELWNPHQNAAQASSLPNGPINLRIHLRDGVASWILGYEKNPDLRSTALSEPVEFDLDPAALEFSRSASSFESPAMLSDSMSSSHGIRPPGTHPYATVFAGGTIGGTRSEEEAPDQRLGHGGDRRYTFAQSRGGALRMDLQYQKNGQWITYQQFLGGGVAATSDRGGNIISEASEAANNRVGDGTQANAGISFTNDRHWVAGRSRVDPRGSDSGFFGPGPNPNQPNRPDGTGLTTSDRGPAFIFKERQQYGVPQEINPGVTSTGGPFFSQQATQRLLSVGEFADNLRRRDRSNFEIGGGGHPAYSKGGTFLSSQSSLAIAMDIDGVARRGDGNRFQGVRPDAAIPTFGGGSLDKPARPVVLNRMPRSVGEVGFAHRGQMWKSLNLSTGESADAGILDLFSVAEGRVVGGRININSAPVEVLRAILAGTGRNGMDRASDRPSIDTISATQADTIAKDITAIIQNTLDPADAGLLPEVGPFWSRGDLVTRLGALRQDTFNASYPAIKAEREAPVRALAEVSQTRTWNLMIDVVAEAGRFSPTATQLGDFQSRGMARYWIHVSIDRLTGEIVSQSIERVNP